MVFGQRRTDGLPVICGVIGQPIAHSLSPDLHRAAYRWLGLDWQYDRHEVGADQVPDFLAGLETGWRGLSVTMPCKRAIVACGRPGAVVAALGVGNTLVFDGSPADPATTRVANTDVWGIEQVLIGHDFNPAAPTAVWGNGATAGAVVYALARLGVERVVVRARDAGKTADLAARARGWGIEVVPHTPPTVGSFAAAVISTVPAPVAAQWIRDEPIFGVVFDVLYNPWPTPLAAWAAAEGVALATGLDLLAAQAVGQVELMTGQAVPVEVLYEAGCRALADRQSA